MSYLMVSPMRKGGSLTDTCANSCLLCGGSHKYMYMYMGLHCTWERLKNGLREIVLVAGEKPETVPGIMYIT